MRKLKVKIDKELHEVIYIEYQDNIPHSAITTHFVTTAKEPYWVCYYWDFFAEKGDKLDLRTYNSGFGGDIKDIESPQWIDGYIGEYWLREDLIFKEEVKNGKRLMYPKKIKNSFKTSINPFLVAEIAYSENYCQMCDEYSEEYCWEHICEDEDGNLKYKHDNSSIDD